ncbi:hypothetical protein [Pseudarthrobacter sp. BIM B-2242]|uniref:hypothetical protein n=1 Tax=Pseudarthrobacter sp. BIM B-2242 TaxID=2772401 RepID=UPI00168B8B4B|nr:hypothetical protein [Pseudarthrobacter sp. BIM B-2242]QOD04880.1 hypothetical protein IDT60_07660 [Pseudarthrobacter sp. BIM B-2242]
MTAKLSRQDLIDLCEVFKTKALEEHELFRVWRDRALEAESRLAIYEPNDESPKQKEAT